MRLSMMRTGRSGFNLYMCESGCEVVGVVGSALSPHPTPRPKLILLDRVDLVSGQPRGHLLQCCCRLTLSSPPSRCFELQPIDGK